MNKYFGKPLPVNVPGRRERDYVQNFGSEIQISKQLDLAQLSSAILKNGENAGPLGQILALTAVMTLITACGSAPTAGPEISHTPTPTPDNPTPLPTHTLAPTSTHTLVPTTRPTDILSTVRIPECKNIDSVDQISVANKEKTAKPFKVSRNDALGSLDLLAPDSNAEQLKCWDAAVRKAVDGGILTEDLEGDRSHVETMRNLKIFTGKDQSGKHPVPNYVDWDPKKVPAVDEKGTVVIAEGIKMINVLKAVVAKHADTDRANGAIAKLQEILSPWKFNDTTRFTPCLTHQSQVDSITGSREDQITFDVITHFNEKLPKRFARILGQEDEAGSSSNIGMIFRIMDRGEFYKFQSRMHKAGLDYESFEIKRGKVMVLAAMAFGVDGPEVSANMSNVGQGGWFERCGSPVEATFTPSPTPTLVPTLTPTPPDRKTPAPPPQPPSEPEKGSDPYVSQADRENKGTGGTSGKEDTKTNEP